MIETLIAGKTYDAVTVASLRKLQTLTEAENLLKQSDARYAEVESDIEELEGEKQDLEAICHALEDIIPLWETALEMPEVIEQLELMAAVNSPNQAKFDFPKDGADGENLDQ